MPLQITYHSANNADHARFDFGANANVMPPQSGSRVSLAVGASAQNATAVSENLFARLRADGEDCVVAWGASATAVAAQHLEMTNGTVEWIYLKSGERISVIAAA